MQSKIIHLTGNLPMSRERAAKLVSAAIYPAILLAVGGGVSAFLISYVVPRFAEVYQGAGRNLPGMSRMMLGWGQFVTEHGLLLLGGLVLAGTMLATARSMRGDTAPDGDRKG